MLAFLFINHTMHAVAGMIATEIAQRCCSVS